SYAQSGIVLQVNSNPVINVVLQVGQVSDEVEVQANAALVETRSTAVGQVMENVRILELPLNGRQVTDLIVLSGAAVGGGAQATNSALPAGIILRIPSPSAAASITACYIYWMAAHITIRTTISICRCRFRMHSRNLKSKPALYRLNTGNIPRRRSTP